MLLRAPSPLGRRSSALVVVPVLLLGVGLGAAACAGKPPPAPVEEPKARTSIVNATVVVAKCPDDSQMNSKAAQRAIEKLVEGCSTVPGGKAHFSATLLPGGRITLASPAGNAADGVVPTCVLEHKLVHTVLLKSPCGFDVQLEERKVSTGGSAADARDGG